MKKESESRRLPLNSPLAKGKKKANASRASRSSSTLPAFSRANPARTPDTLGSWSDDWGDNSVNGSDVGGDQNHDFDAESPVVHQTQPEFGSDVGLLVSEDDSIKREDREESALVKASTNQTQYSPGNHFSFRDRLGCLPRNVVAQAKNRWWLLAFALFLVIGGGFKETVPRHPTIMALMRQKKNSLPSPVRLTGKNPESFSLKSTTW